MEMNVELLVLVLAPVLGRGRALFLFFSFLLNLSAAAHVRVVASRVARLFQQQTSKSHVQVTSWDCHQEMVHSLVVPTPRPNSTSSCRRMEFLTACFQFYSDI